MCQLIRQCPVLFNDIPTQTAVVRHVIDVAGATLVKQHAYKQNDMSEEVRYLLEHGLARPSNSPWSSPCILVPKPDGTFCFCTDSRKVNALTILDSLPK